MLDSNAHTCLFLWEFCEVPFSKKKNFHSSGDLWGLCTTPPATAAALPPPTPTPTAGASASATALSCSFQAISFGSPVMTPRTPSLFTAYLGRKVPLITAQKEAPVIKVCHVEQGGRNCSCVYMEPVERPLFLGFNPPRPKALSLPRCQQRWWFLSGDRKPLL